MRSRKPAVVAALLGLSGCSLAPDYHRPEVAAATTYKEVPSGWTVAAPAADAGPAAWWEGVGGPGRVAGRAPARRCRARRLVGGVRRPGADRSGKPDREGQPLARRRRGAL